MQHGGHTLPGEHDGDGRDGAAGIKEGAGLEEQARALGLDDSGLEKREGGGSTVSALSCSTSSCCIEGRVAVNIPDGGVGAALQEQICCPRSHRMQPNTEP